MMHANISEHGMLFNCASDCRPANSDDELDNVLHIFDVYWHGIRSATSCLPGYKVAISHKQFPDGDALHYLFTQIAQRKVDRVCFQGMSNNGFALAELIKGEFGSAVQCYAVTHVSSAQFGNEFEMDMLRGMVERKTTGVFARLGSVKPRFHGTVPDFAAMTLINACPRLDNLGLGRNTKATLIPVENNWRKNLFSNVLGAHYASSIEEIQVVNWPTGMDKLVPLTKVKWLPFARPIEMLARLASVGTVVHASLIECQPMTHLEALAVGTPCLTTHLGVHPEVDSHELSKITEFEYPDDVGTISRILDSINEMWEKEPEALRSMISDMVNLRRRLCFESYHAFFA